MPQWTTKYPELGNTPLPVWPNISPEYFELERERIFKRSWLNVGRVEDIPQAGDYFVKELALPKTSVIVVSYGGLALGGAVKEPDETGAFDATRFEIIEPESRHQ